MEHGASELVKEESHMVMTVKAEVDKAAQSTAYRGVQTNANITAEEPGLADDVKSEPALLVKEEVVEDDWRDIPELQCMQGPSTSAIVGSANVLDTIGDLHNTLSVKEELGAIDIGPTVLQHTDTWYTTNQKDVSVVKEERTINHDKTDPILCVGVEEEIIEDKWGADTDDQRSNKASQSKQRARSQLYSCDKCGKTYASKNSLLAHNRNLHSKESHKCTKCNKKFPSKLYLYRHTSTAHSEQQYECAVCKKICRSKRALSLHVYQVHRPRPAVSSPVFYTCDYCHKMYARKLGLVQHIDVVHTKALYRCSECKKEYPGKLYLQAHIRRVHSKEKHEGSRQMHTCTNCGKDFKSKQYCQRHEKSVKCTRPTASNTSAAASTSRQQHNVEIVKEEPADGELELGPVVFQHMDCNYRPYKQEPGLD